MNSEKTNKSTLKDVGAYLLHNPETDETYVGSGVLTKRRTEHYRELVSGTHHNENLQNAYNKNPNFEFIAVPMQDRDEAFSLEQAIIDEQWGNPLFLNLSRNARACCVEITPEIRANMSAANLGKNLGRKHSEETNERNRQRNLGKVLSPETIAKRVAKITGVPRAPEVIEKIRLLCIGREHTEESKNKMSVAAKARGYSDNAIAGMKKAISIPIVADGVVYESASAAAREYGIDPSTALTRVRNAKVSNWMFSVSGNGDGQ